MLCVFHFVCCFIFSFTNSFLKCILYIWVWFLLCLVHWSEEGGASFVWFVGVERVEDYVAENKKENGNGDGEMEMEREDYVSENKKEKRKWRWRIGVQREDYVAENSKGYGRV